LFAFIFLCFCGCAPAASAPNGAGPSAETIIQKSVQANQTDWEQAPQYDYFERDQEANHTKTYQVIMLDGSPYSRLVATDDKALTPKQQAAEEQKVVAYWAWVP
jgi:hypothetical protein